MSRYYMRIGPRTNTLVWPRPYTFVLEDWREFTWFAFDWGSDSKPMLHIGLRFFRYALAFYFRYRPYKHRTFDSETGERFDVPDRPFVIEANAYKCLPWG